MKTQFLITLLALSMPILASAQTIQDVVFNFRGGYNILLQLGDGQSVTITQSGGIIDFDMEGKIEVVGSNRDRYLIKSIGDVEFQYADDRHPFTKLTPVTKIGDVEIEYTTISCRRYHCPSISKIGGITIEYYPADAERTLAGKVMRFGDIVFDYYNADELSEDAYSNISKQKQGLLKKIDRFEYDYFDFGTEYAGVSGYNKSIYKTEVEKKSTKDSDGNEKIEEVKKEVLDKAAMADAARRFGAIQMRTLSSRIDSGMLFNRWGANGTGISGKKIVVLDGLIIYIVD